MILHAKESGGTMFCSPSASGLHSGWPRARLSLGACGPSGQPGPWPALVQSLGTGGAKHSTSLLFCKHSTLPSHLFMRRRSSTSSDIDLDYSLDCHSKNFSDTVMEYNNPVFLILVRQQWIYYVSIPPISMRQ